MMTMHKLISATAVLCGIFSFAGPSSVAAKDALDDKALQRRRDLREQGPMSNDDAAFLRKLLSKKTVRLSRKDTVGASDIANNPFAKAIRNKGRMNGRKLLGNRDGIFDSDTESRIGSSLSFGGKQNPEPEETPEAQAVPVADTTRSGHKSDYWSPTTTEAETSEFVGTSTTGTATEHHDNTQRGGTRQDHYKRGGRKSNGGYDE
jgi:hypothetical protein